MNHADTRRALHIPEAIPLLSEDCSNTVEDALNVDSMKDLRGLFSFLLAHLPITVFTGCWDLLDGTWSNEVFLDSLSHWKDREQWFISRRFTWRPLPCIRTHSGASTTRSPSSISIPPLL